ncbi:hypothetical protein BKA67DRAFT_519305 [Truncatella angustata]|uniref:Uncharacterized protein n=1 Tax=Truncatella angustata TaxID=152316 RepID=A0A9P8UK02_9PEZI|nr:uncharacterized protein BKA67DRAFT_519305 [Truncatella angustata]KAH6653413.1 hypothetical protein BKA67DRAFT_519305 [Truncatella angustata]
MPARVPNEISQKIAEELDSASLVSAIQAGLPVNESTFRRAQHAFVWRTVLRNDFATIERLLKTSGNMFLMGSGVEHLYNGIFEIPKPAPDPLPIIVAWTAETMID